MRVLFFGLALFMLPTAASAKTYCERNPIYCKIMELQPRMNKSEAMKLSNLIAKAAKKHGVDPMVSVAILNQENNFRDKHTWQITKKIKNKCGEDSCTQTITETKEVFDMTIAQINVKTAADYNFDLVRLFEHDTEYAIDCHFTILKDKIRMCADLGDEAWSCYHSKTPVYREKYVELVSRYL